MADQHETAPHDSASSGWTGIVVFAGILFILLGGAEAAMAITAGFNEPFYQVPSTELVVSLSYPLWGWVHLALGALAVVTGWGLLTGRRWASATGIALALVNAAANLLFMRAYPWWSLTAIALNVLVIYAITRHPSEELRRPEWEPAPEVGSPAGGHPTHSSSRGDVEAGESRVVEAAIRFQGAERRERGKT